MNKTATKRGTRKQYGSSSSEMYVEHVKFDAILKEVNTHKQVITSDITSIAYYINTK